MKLHHRLDYARLAEALAERGLCEPQALREALQLSGHGSTTFAEAIVQANLVGDWELCKVVAEIYNLPFLPLDLCEPDQAALDGLDLAYLAEHALVPLGRFGKVLTLAMPGMVSADVLTRIPVRDRDTCVLPVVGSVTGNRRWVDRFLAPKLQAQLPAMPGENHASGGGEWGNLFDAGDAAVLFDLNGDPPGAH